MHEFDRCILIDAAHTPVSEGFVRSFDNGVMEIMSAKDIAGWVQAGQSVQVHVYNSSLGECVYEGRVQSVMLLHVYLDGLQLITNRQKRNNTRVNTELPYLMRYYEDADGAHPFEKPVPVTILNVSAAGVYVACKERFDIGLRFVFTFRETARDIRVTAEIVRRDISPNGFHYGCRFADIPEKDANEIHRWVFTQQIEQRRRQFF
ncbi:PilZ domain-containing protein [Ethanoligenens harbinense]|uniref:Type IV pilus assembly PilZ n=1 Tax=Ethanoligenens harbinense (strain DSM 18485 / JCM 12961 / CGMCC 1.5033 / YUAN-3) TaxID=663278 RepID=E6U754_ETHHY|nr:PilZ domain-containing protein [Ethanoligenens harbinense]ADU28124.1 type IV pilus assembly PilZ [Ethanoligenens harbinense YUAN-3]AVQ97132.1 PilZ domain-containing protein [Ethanoligenens harbinense YUAN-3]AYF39794.1 PilZ domain-containing protein [Ethanoligenens harbinense]AYF42626.1 PilZ domain-containing protein [Ethanoligenens harbinense]QCN93375.1 PilZ domain-containing protein [Ethanoligenens harbinense]